MSIAEAPSPIAGRMRTPHDHLFRALFGNAAEASSLLRAAAPADLRELVDWPTLRRLPPDQVSAALGDLRGDLVFEASATAENVGTLYFLVEHPSRSDRWMAWRLSRYAHALLRACTRGRRPPRWLPAVVPVVIYHGRHRWMPSRLSELVGDAADSAPLRRHVPELDCLVFDLGRYPGLVAGTPTARLGHLVLRHGTRGGVLAALETHADLLRAVAAEDPDAFQEAARYTLVVAETPADVTISRLLPLIHDSHAKGLIMTAGQELIERGRVEGRVEAE